ncbi:RNA-directed DNA polymerase, eukaryota, reverse transcriptase zinc-binding domain protein [Tanacetum coccineum]
MLVEMADMRMKVPIGIVENVLLRIDKFLFPFNFVVIDMLEERNETMILGRPFIATIHAEINVFNKEISLGDGEPCKIITPPPHKSPLCLELDGNCNLHNRNNNTLDNDGMQERFGKKARIDETDPTTPKNGKLREWYYRHDDKRSGLTGEGLSFPDCLLVKYRDSQGPIKDPRSRSFDDYKWVFDLEIDQLADEYELGIGKKGHILEEI